MTKLIPIRLWTQQGIEDCSECPEELCDFCNGPEDLPRALRLKQESASQPAEAPKNCLSCPIETNLYLCCGYKPVLEQAGLLFKHVILVSDEGLSLQSVCSFLTPEGKCGNYEKRPLICRTYHC